MPQIPKMPIQQGANLGALDLDTNENFELYESEFAKMLQLADKV